MARSTFTNQLVKSLLGNNENTLIIDDGGKKHYCHSFKESCEVIDSVDEVTIQVKRRFDNYSYGSCWLILCNDGIEQLYDHSDNDFFNRHYERLSAKYA